MSLDGRKALRAQHVLAVAAGKGEGKLDQIIGGPFGAIGQLVKGGHFLCRKPDFDLPGERKIR